MIYEVVSPVYETGSYWEPPEPTCDWALVEAPNAKAAKWAAHKYWQKTQTETYWQGDTHPLSGIKAMPFEIPDDEDFDIELELTVAAG